MADGVEVYQEEENENETEKDEKEVKDEVKKEIKEEDEEEIKFVCPHYKCRCAYISPCCGNEYVCRVCHNMQEDHEIDRFLVTQIVCLLCKHRQPVTNTCEKCNITFGNYFCAVCRMFDDNDRQQFHCDKCGICRVGGRDNFFHCDKCEICLDLSLKDSHKCIEGASRGDCPVCLEDLHSSREPLVVFKCGHICHQRCRNNLFRTGNYYCPLCCQSICDMGSLWRQIDDEIEGVAMPEEYQHTKHWILCRDCHQLSETPFHVLGLKCLRCGSYNTCREAAPLNPPVGASDASNHPLFRTTRPRSPSTSSSDLSSDGETVNSTAPTSTIDTSNTSTTESTTQTASSVTIPTDTTSNHELPTVLGSNLYATSSISSATNTTLSNQHHERQGNEGDNSASEGGTGVGTVGELDN